MNQLLPAKGKDSAQKKLWQADTDLRVPGKIPKPQEKKAKSPVIGNMQTPEVPPVKGGFHYSLIHHKAAIFETQNISNFFLNCQ